MFKYNLPSVKSKNWNKLYKYYKNTCVNSLFTLFIYTRVYIYDQIYFIYNYTYCVVKLFYKHIDVEHIL